MLRYGLHLNVTSYHYSSAVTDIISTRVLAVVWVKSPGSTSRTGLVEVDSSLTQEYQICHISSPPQAFTNLCTLSLKLIYIIRIRVQIYVTHPWNTISYICFLGDIHCMDKTIKMYFKNIFCVFKRLVFENWTTLNGALMARECI